MYCVRKMTEDLYWVGASERRLNLFENAYPLTNGVSYNSYLLLDEKTVLIDTVDKSVSGLFFENIDHVLGGRKLDYLIVQHMEPDHAATIGELVLRHPELTIVCNAKTRTMMQNFFTFDIDSRLQLVKEMDTLTTGRHTFAFVMAPMVHWPEVMVSYDTTTKTLYSADAFGTFGALNGNLYADEVNFRTEWLADARRYYTNIVGKYGTQVQALLKKAAGLEIEMICPLHGPVWRKDIAWFLDKYIHWATYTPEDDAVVIAYASVYGGTENAANVLAAKLSELGVRNVQMYDVSVTHPSYILSECFRASHLVFISTTYNAGMFVTMENLVHDIVHHNLQNRTIALMENGSWAPTAAGLMRAEFQKLKNCTILDEGVSIRSSLKEDQLAQMEALHAQNTDLVAWLTIDNVLDLPVVYRDNSYYLTHDFAKNKSTAGTIFLDENHPMTEKTQNLLLHGHNMKDGTMFGRLTQYEKSIDYLKAHPFVDFSTLWHQERYVIFAVVDVSLDTSSENFLDYFAHPRFSSDAEFASYIRRAELASMYAIPMDVKPSDALLTLSTCLEENRLVVIARRQRDGESKASLRETVNMAVRQ